MTISRTHLAIVWYRLGSISETVQCSPSEWGNSPIVLNLQSKMFCVLWTRVSIEHWSLSPGGGHRIKRKERYASVCHSVRTAPWFYSHPSLPPLLPTLSPVGWHLLSTLLHSFPGHTGLPQPILPASAARLEPATQPLCSWSPAGQTQKRRLRKDCSQHRDPFCRSWFFSLQQSLREREIQHAPSFFPDLVTETGISSYPYVFHMIQEIKSKTENVHSLKQIPLPQGFIGFSGCWI